MQLGLHHKLLGVASHITSAGDLPCHAIEFAIKLLHHNLMGVSKHMSHLGVYIRDLTPCVCTCCPTHHLLPVQPTSIFDDCILPNTMLRLND